MRSRNSMVEQDNSTKYAKILVHIDQSVYYIKYNNNVNLINRIKQKFSIIGPIDLEDIRNPYLLDTKIFVEI